jgi:hypothetical protein
MDFFHCSLLFLEGIKHFVPFLKRRTREKVTPISLKSQGANSMVPDNGGTESARRFGRLKASLEARGQPRSEPDLRIAAIALQHRMTIVTGNARHFAGIPGLAVENWLE